MKDRLFRRRIEFSDQSSRWNILHMTPIGEFYWVLPFAVHNLEVDNLVLDWSLEDMMLAVYNGYWEETSI